MRLFGRRRPPAGALEGLDRDERVLAWGATDDDDTVLATPLGLWVPTEDGRRRIRWHEINKAAWNDGVLVVTEAVAVDEPSVAGPAVDDVVVEDALPCRWTISEPGKLPAVIRKRVEGSVAFTEHHAIGEVGVRVVARRVPGRDGLAWFVRYDRAGDHEIPGVQAQVELLLAEARERMAPPD